jgi:hypothetical protein
MATAATVVDMATVDGWRDRLVDCSSVLEGAANFLLQHCDTKAFGPNAKQAVSQILAAEFAGREVARIANAMWAIDMDPTEEPRIAARQEGLLP